MQEASFSCQPLDTYHYFHCSSDLQVGHHSLHIETANACMQSSNVPCSDYSSLGSHCHSNKNFTAHFRTLEGTIGAH